MIDGRATFSADRMYRYTLTRWLKGGDSLSYVNFILLNPSTATESEDDPTIRRCCGFAEDWGYPSLVVTNLFAYRATSPRDMMNAQRPIGSENDYWLSHIALGANQVVLAWGNHGTFLHRASTVLADLVGPLYCLGLTKVGQPRHPLYLSRRTELVPWKDERLGCVK